MTNDEYQDYVWELACHDTGKINGMTAHMLLGIVTEVGELADCFKKCIGYKQIVNGTNVVEEMGDLLFYLSGLARHYGLSLEELMIKNKEKLDKRYPNGYTDKDAIERKDKA
jgi:NTP pyrophosphatase (non-canonical NTP hydrolase)